MNTVTLKGREYWGDEILFSPTLTGTLIINNYNNSKKITCTPSQYVYV